MKCILTEVQERTNALDLPRFNAIRVNVTPNAGSAGTHNIRGKGKGSVEVAVVNKDTTGDAIFSASYGGTGSTVYSSEANGNFNFYVSDVSFNWDFLEKESLTEFRLPNTCDIDLEEMEYCDSLITLVLQGKKSVGDISIIGNFTSLTTLDISNGLYTGNIVALSNCLSLSSIIATATRYIEGDLLELATSYIAKGRTSGTINLPYIYANPSLKFNGTKLSTLPHSSVETFQLIWTSSSVTLRCDNDIVVDL